MLTVMLLHARLNFLAFDFLFHFKYAWTGHFAFLTEHKKLVERTQAPF